MEKNLDQIPPLAGVEALNKNSALHKALAEMQHWQRCSRLLQEKLNEIEDRNFNYKIAKFAAYWFAFLAITGWSIVIFR